MMCRIPASRCPCGGVTAPPTRYCPTCGLEMTPHSLPNLGILLSYTLLFVPPEGFAAPLPLALVALEGGVKLICHGHGEETGEYRIGRQVMIEEVDSVYYFSTLSLSERVQLFWRRRGEVPEKVVSIVKSLLRLSGGRPRKPSSPPE